ncbi:CPBP family intramembrane glutamic endopeptidase [Halococcus sediminicola]|uniref:CPBP family intramembrane glutamic endopeptidase n=1 Tax=Halococcus sediminicola TaxID=1264579 RepID=UPI0006787C52|nr:type II CAAX endopeptidase family protein [Halococcus sediminicola]
MSDTDTGRLRALGVALAVGVLGLVVAALLGAAVILPLVFVGIELGALALLVVGLITGQGIAFGGVALLYLRLRGLGFAYIGARLPSLRDAIAAVSGYLLAFVGLFVGTALVTLTQVETAQNQVGQLAIDNPEVLLFLIPASFLLIGPGEELLFRGIVQGRLREAFGPVSGVVLASAIFAAIHFTALTGGVGGRLATIGVLFFPSLVFGAAYEFTDNLVVPAFIHGAYNATLFTLLYLFLQAGGMPAGAA